MSVQYKTQYTLILHYNYTCFRIKSIDISIYSTEISSLKSVLQTLGSWSGLSRWLCSLHSSGLLGPFFPFSIDSLQKHVGFCASSLWYLWFANKKTKVTFFDRAMVQFFYHVPGKTSVQEQLGMEPLEPVS